jgi:YegS/Rv2252/BmrU family lipid kinase
VDHVFTERPRHAVELARQLSDRFDVIVAAGGDGTMNEVVTGALLAGGKPPTLGVVPMGTGNDVAGLVGITTLEDAVEALARGDARTMDAIEVQCTESGRPLRHFALMHAAVGFASELVKQTTPAVKRLFGPSLCYSVGLLRALWRLRSPRMRVWADGQETHARLFHVCAGNSEWAGGGMMRLSPGAKIDDGQFDICLVEELGRLETLRHLPRLFKGTHVTHPKVRYFRGRTLRVEADPPSGLMLDGDLIGHTPATFEIRPAAIRILALATDRVTY